jgi:hypothetical protein
MIEDTRRRDPLIHLLGAMSDDVLAEVEAQYADIEGAW